MSNYGRGKFCYDCNWGHAPSECGDNPENKEGEFTIKPAYADGRYCYDCGFDHTTRQHEQWLVADKRKELDMAWKDPNIDMPEKKTFTKRLMKWGLLCRVALADKPWRLVDSTDYVFDTLEAALAQANEFNTGHGKPAYLYRPVELLMVAEVPEERSGE